MKKVKKTAEDKKMDNRMEIIITIVSVIIAMTALGGFKLFGFLGFLVAGGLAIVCWGPMMVFMMMAFHLKDCHDKEKELAKDLTK